MTFTQSEKSKACDLIDTYNTLISEAHTQHKRPHICIGIERIGWQQSWW